MSSDVPTTNEEEEDATKAVDTNRNCVIDLNENVDSSSKNEKATRSEGVLNATDILKPFCKVLSPSRIQEYLVYTIYTYPYVGEQNTADESWKDDCFRQKFINDVLCTLISQILIIVVTAHLYYFFFPRNIIAPIYIAIPVMVFTHSVLLLTLTVTVLLLLQEEFRCCEPWNCYGLLTVSFFWGFYSGAYMENFSYINVFICIFGTLLLLLLTVGLNCCCCCDLTPCKFIPILAIFAFVVYFISGIVSATISNPTGFYISTVFLLLTLALNFSQNYQLLLGRGRFFFKTCDVMAATMWLYFDFLFVYYIFRATMNTYLIFK